jgi:glycosyltransferase involved in cell wall biosynthesis
MKTSIALCTYNGEEFLREQLDSIAGQTLLPDELVVCDDCSSDGTIDIVNNFRDSAPFPVQIHINEKNLGLTNNFSKAMDLCQGKWVALCDQDDRWLPKKLERLTGKMAQLEEVHGEDTPLLVHSDAIVADTELQTIDNSLWGFQRTSPQRGDRLGRLLSQNVVTGCTTLFNQTLWRKAMPIPETAMMHDWWLALAAAAFGGIGHVPEPMILYRQHGQNDTGAKKWNSRIALRLFLDLKSRKSAIEANKAISNRIRNQAREFLSRYNEDLSYRQKQTLQAFIALPERSYCIRNYFIVRYGLHYHGLLRNLGNLILK